MMKKVMWSMLTLSMLLTGCSSSNTAGLRIDGQTQKVMFQDNVLNSRLKVDNIETKTVDGHARGIVSLSSQYKADQTILYRFYWYDDDGLEVNSNQAPWKMKIIRGFETLGISEVSVNPNGTQFRVQIRQAE